MAEQGQIDRKPNGDYRFDSSPGRGPSHAQVAVDAVGNFAVWTKGSPRGYVERHPAMPFPGYPACVAPSRGVQGGEQS